jgi:ELWxxDGT repeat protein
MAADINGGTGSSNPASFTLAANMLFFVALDPASGREVWRTDGTVTALVRDVMPGVGSSNPVFLAAVGNLLFFVASDPALGQEPFVSDGTIPGTVLLKDIFPGTPGSLARSPGAFGSRLLFAAYDGVTGWEPWITDGTTAGTVLLADVNPGPPPGIPSTGAFFFSPAGSARAVFAANDGSSGVELWRTDGTTAGTVPHQDVSPGVPGSNPGVPTLAGSLLFFAANDGVTGNELWAMTSMACSVPYGTGCPGTGGLVPRISGFGPPTLGNPGYAMQVTQARAMSSAVLAFNIFPAEIPLGGGCTFYVNLLGLLVFVTPIDGSGQGAVPGAPALVGAQVFGQYGIVDPMGSFSGLSMTGGLKVVINAN